MNCVNKGLLFTLGLLIAVLSILCGCKGGATAPRIPTMKGKGEEIVFQETEVMTIKEGPEGVLGSAAIK